MVHATGYTFSYNSDKPNYFSINLDHMVFGTGISSLDEKSDYVSVVANAVLRMSEGQELAVSNGAQNAWWTGGSFSAYLFATGFDDDDMDNEYDSDYE